MDAFAKNTRKHFEYHRPNGTPEQLEGYCKPQGVLFARLNNGELWGVAFLNFQTWQECCDFRLPETVA